MVRHRLLVALLLLFLAVPGRGAAAVRKLATVEGISSYALDNGLLVLLFPDDSKPTVTVNITYLVGSRHEGYGETGMAHLLEHMLFKGSPAHPDLIAELDRHGAEFNGTTTFDRTNYFETLLGTAENLRFALAMEADRMTRCNLLVADLLREFSVVRNELETGENSPDEVLRERMYSAAFLWHGYGRDTIGARSDIEHVSIDSLRAFYRRYYQPDNAVLVVAGRFAAPQALRIIVEQFGRIARPARPLRPTHTVEPAQDGERAVVLRRRGEVAAVGLLYHGLPAAHPDFVAEQAVIDILVHEGTGRLYKALVAAGLATKVSGEADATAEPGVLYVMAQARREQPLAPLRDKMIAVVEGLADAAIGQEELRRFQARARNELELLMTDSQRMAIALSDWAAAGDWRLLFLHRDQLAKLTVEQVRKVARDYLLPANRTEGSFIPTAQPLRSPLPAAVEVAALVRGYQGRPPPPPGEAFVATLDNVERRTRRLTLPSGMQVALLEKRTRGSTVRLLLTVRIGSESDLRGRAAALELLPGMLLRGTRKRSYQQINDALDDLMAKVEIAGPDALGASHDGVHLSVTTVRDSLPAVLALLAEMMREPSFPKDQFATYKKEQMAALEQQLGDPLARASTALLRRLATWPPDDVRYTPTTEERLARLRAVRLEEVARLHQELWGGGAAQLTLVGDFDTAATERVLAAQLGDWRAARLCIRLPLPYRAHAAAQEVIRTPDRQMAVVALVQALPLGEDDDGYPAMTLLNFLLGASENSRLSQRVREKEGLSYSVASLLSTVPMERHSRLSMFATCAPQNAGRTLQILWEELSALLQKGVTAGELQAAKQAYQRFFAAQLGQDEFLAELLSEALYQGRGLDFYQRMNARIAALTVADLQAAARAIEPTRFIQVMAGDL